MKNIIKKKYNLSDPVWINGISQGILTEGKIVKIFDLANAGYPKNQLFYVIEIPTEVDSLLEIRSWEGISQDEAGPIGLYRSLDDSTSKFMRDMGSHIPTNLE